MRRSPRVLRIIAVLDEHPGLTAAEVARRLGLGDRQALMLLHRLEEDGDVLREANRFFARPA